MDAISVNSVVIWPLLIMFFCPMFNTEDNWNVYML